MILWPQYQQGRPRPLARSRRTSLRRGTPTVASSGTPAASGQIAQPLWAWMRWDARRRADAIPVGGKERQLGDSSGEGGSDGTLKQGFANGHMTDDTARQRVHTLKRWVEAKRGFPRANHAGVWPR